MDYVLSNIVRGTVGCGASTSDFVFIVTEHR